MGKSPTAAGIALAASSVSWTFASIGSGRLMIRTSYRLAAGVGGVCLIAGSAVLMTLNPLRQSRAGGHRRGAHGDRHGLLQHRLCRLDPGERRLERAGNGHQFDNVHAHGRIVGRRVGIRSDRQFRHPSPAAGSRRRGQPVDAAGGAPGARYRRARPVDRGDRELGARRLRDRWAHRGSESILALALPARLSPTRQALFERV